MRPGGIPLTIAARREWQQWRSLRTYRQCRGEAGILEAVRTGIIQIDLLGVGAEEFAQLVQPLGPEFIAVTNEESAIR